MALAPFFDKTALAAAALLRGFDRESFAEALDAQVIGVAFDDAAVQCPEGRTTLSLVVNLLARLFPRIAIRSSGTLSAEFRSGLRALASAVNPKIEYAGEEAETSALLVVGTTAAADFGADSATVVIYLGSSGWEAHLSRTRAVGSGPTPLPFGAAAAACLGLANVFRHVFSAQLPDSALDNEVTLSTLTLDVRVGVEARTTISVDAQGTSASRDVDIGHAVLVGAGAVGQGALWTLARMSTLHGTLDVVDGEQLDATNPQRYVLTAAVDDRAWKVALAEGLMHPERDPARATPHESDTPVAGLIVRQIPAADRSAIQLIAHPRRWGQYLAEHVQPFRLRRVLVALDSARDRIAVQAALPKWIANAWTQPGDLGLSRHEGFGNTACLACQYMPTGRGARNEDEIVAESVGMTSELMLVRQLLATGAPVDVSVITKMASGLGVPVESLLVFAGRPLRAFYSEAICGGMVLRLRGQSAPDQMGGPRAAPSDNGTLHETAEHSDGPLVGGQPVDRAAMVPMAFQSVMAGVLLAAAVVAEAAGLAAPSPTQKAVMNLLRPLPGRLLVPVARHSSGRCLCQDSDYQDAFSAQWNDDATAPPLPALQIMHLHQNAETVRPPT